MLIRSQNGMVLMNIQQIFKLLIMPNDCGSEWCIIAMHPVTEDHWALGAYSTCDKAKDVLQEIQNQYQYLMECKYIGIGSSQPEFVYQMPKED